MWPTLIAISGNYSLIKAPLFSTIPFVKLKISSGFKISHLLFFHTLPSEGVPQSISVWVYVCRGVVLYLTEPALCFFYHFYSFRCFFNYQFLFYLYVLHLVLTDVFLKWSIFVSSKKSIWLSHSFIQCSNLLQSTSTSISYNIVF